MALVKKVRASQVPLVLEFVINMADTMANTSSVVQGLNANGAFDFADPPPGFVLLSGSAVTETALSGGGVTAATLALGDSSSATRYASAATVLAAGATVNAVPTGYTGQGESLRATLAFTGGNPTAGKIRVRLTYTLDGRANEVL